MRKSDSARRALPLLIFLLPLLVRLETLQADTLTGEVRGSVLDVDGGVPLPSVEVTLQNVDRGWERRQSTDEYGAFSFLQLEPGNYTVTAAMEGYYAQEKTGVLVRLNQPKVVIPPFQLRKEVPTPTQQITLRGEQTRTALIDLTTTGPNPVILAYLSEPGLTSLVALLDWAIRRNYEASVLAALPLRGLRTFDQLALLSPGVFRVPDYQVQGPAVGVGVGSPGQFSVNGMRGRSNNFTVDGSDNNDEDIGVRRQGFVSLVPQSNESIREFEITTAGFSAEFGRNAGAMVNAVSKSGQSTWHGQVYGIFNHDSLNARGFFETDFEDNTNTGDQNGGQFTGDDCRETALGGTLGGPILAEKLFFFGSLERQDRKGTRIGHFLVPTTNERGLRTTSGLVPIAELGDFFRQRGIPRSNIAGEGVFSLYPLPNNPHGPFDEHTYSQAIGHDADGTILSGKLDWYLTDVHSLAGRYNFTDDHSLLPFTSDALYSSLATETRTQNLSLFLNSATPRYGNAFRFSYGRTALDFPARQGSPLIFGSTLPDPVPPSIENVPGLGRQIETPYGTFGPFGTTGPVGQLTISPYSTIGVDVYNFPQGRVDNTLQASNAFTVQGSRSTLKVGVDFRFSQLNSFSDRNSRPWLFFGPGLISPSCLSNPQCLFNLEDGLLHGSDLAALGTPSSLFHTLDTQAIPNSTIGLSFAQYDSFVQADWRVTRHLNINTGLRYELQTTPTEQNRKIESTFGVTPGEYPHLDPGNPPDSNIVAGNLAFDTALEAQQNFLGARTRIYETDRNNFAPRIGFAWDPLGSGKMVVRGGYGISYDANLGAVTSQSRNVFPTFVPLNLDPNFVAQVPAGYLIPNTVFFELSATGQPLVRPGTINSYNLQDDAFATGIGTAFLQTIPGSGLLVNGLAFTLPERKPKTSYAQHFVLSLQRQFGDNWLGSLEYVGTRGLHLVRFTTPNAGMVSTPFLISTPFSPVLLAARSPGIPPGTFTRSISGLGAFTLFENSATSDYHSLQAAVEKRFSRGLEFRGTWTWSHAIDQVSDPFDGRGFFSLPQDSTLLTAERGSASFDARHRGTFYFIWEVPGVDRTALLQNWRLSTIGEFQSGQPYTVNTTLDRNGDGNLTDRLDSVEGLFLDPGSSRPIVLSSSVSKLDLVAPSLKAGQVGRNTFRGDSVATIDVALSRSIPLSETAKLDLRIEAFNLFNHTQFGIPIRILESPGFGRAYDTRVAPRMIRFAFNLSF